MLGKVDIKKSLEISRKCRSLRNKCYENIFNCIVMYGLKEYEICLGYTLTNSFGMLNRHIWLVNKEGVIIDPTYVITRHEEIKKYKYFYFKKMSKKEYFRSIVESVNKSLTGVYCKEELEFYKKKDTNYFLKKNKINTMRDKSIKDFVFINEIDFGDYILPLLQKERSELNEI